MLETGGEKTCENRKYNSTGKNEKNAVSYFLQAGFVSLVAGKNLV